jgi:hypothetical protein
VFVLDVKFGFNGVIDGPEAESAPDVSVFPLALLVPLPEFPVRAPIPDPLLPDPVGAAIDPLLNVNEMVPKTTTMIGLWFAPENVPNWPDEKPLVPKLEKIGGAVNCA